MDLFELVNGRIVPSTHALMIEPFKTIWETDTTAKKGNAEKVFRYIELVCSPKKSNVFYGYSEKIRPSKVKKEVFGDINYHDTDFMIRGVMKYKELLKDASPSYSIMESAEIAKDKLDEYLRAADLNERTPNGAVVIKPKDYADAIERVPTIVKNLASARSTVHTELLEDAKTRNQREIGEYER